MVFFIFSYLHVAIVADLGTVAIRFIRIYKLVNVM